MILREVILKENSKTNSNKIADWISTDEKRFEELMQLLLTDEYRVVQRSAWIISIIAEKHPNLLQPYLEKMVFRMKEEHLPVAVKRNVLRILQFMHLPKHLHGTVMETGFLFLNDPKEAIAVRVFSMTVLCNLAEIYPDIKPELETSINEVMNQEPAPAFRSRARKVLHQLMKKGNAKIIYL